jgi:hypothetical protein
VSGVPLMLAESSRVESCRTALDTRTRAAAAVRMEERVARVDNMSLQG